MIFKPLAELFSPPLCAIVSVVTLAVVGVVTNNYAAIVGVVTNNYARLLVLSLWPLLVLSPTIPAIVSVFTTPLLVLSPTTTPPLLVLSPTIINMIKNGFNE